MGSKIDFLFIGCFCALLPEKIKILVSKRRMINAYVLVPAALIINTYTDSLSPLQMGRTLNSFGYLCAMVCYGLAVTAASQERNYTLPAVMRWFASRSYYLYVFNFIALVLTWLVIYYIYPNIFYINSYYYQIAQVILGMGILAAMAEFFYRIFERGK